MLSAAANAVLLAEIRADVKELVRQQGAAQVVAATVGRHDRDIVDLYEKHEKLENRMRAQENGSAGSRWVTKGAGAIVTAVITGLVGAVLGLIFVTRGVDKDGIVTRSITPAAARSLQ